VKESVITKIRQSRLYVFLRSEFTRLFPVALPESFRLSEYSLSNNNNHLISEVITEEVLQDLGASLYDQSIPRYHAWPKRFSHLVSNVKINIQTGLVFQGERLINQSGQFFESAFHTAIQNRLQYAPTYVKKLNKAQEYLLIPPVLSYWHWVAEFMPYVLHVTDKHKEVLVLVGNQQPEYVVESLRLMGVNFEQVPQGWFQAEKLWLVDKPAFAYYHPSDISRVREFAKSQRIVVPEQYKKITRVYVSRKGWRRAMKNEDKLEEFLHDAGFYIFRSNEVGSFANQVGVFADAETIVGSSGSGLANLILMSSKSHVIEIFSESFDIIGAATLSASVGSRYSRLSVTPTADFPFGDGNRIISDLQELFKKESLN
jgi:hypothetical protein